MSQLPQYFEIRCAPKPNGHVIAIWRKDVDNHQLIFGTKDVVTDEMSCDEDQERTWARDNEPAIVHYLFAQITEPEFSVHQELSEIPEILSDGVLHHLGILKWKHVWHEFMSGWHHVKRHGTVYARVIDLEASDLGGKEDESADGVS